MFAQFRTQYPQGSIKTEMLPKVDGLHVFRATISHSDVILSTATAADTDIEVAEDRAIKRALIVAGVNFSSYGMKAELVTHATNNAYLSAAATPSLNPTARKHAELSAFEGNHPADASSFHYAPEYAPSYYDAPQEEPMPAPMPTPIVASPPTPPPAPTPSPMPVVASIPDPAPALVVEKTTELMDLSDSLTKIEVEMERVGWTIEQGRDYLQKNFKKKARKQLTPSEVMKFLQHLESLPTPHKLSDEL
jgi:hypothetical protein